MIFEAKHSQNSRSPERAAFRDNGKMQENMLSSHNLKQYKPVFDENEIDSTLAQHPIF